MQVPSADDIQHLKKMVESAKRRQIMWGESDMSTFNERVTSGALTSRPDPRRKTIMVNDHDPVDIASPIKATPLISTTALVQDFIGVPNAVSYIR